MATEFPEEYLKALDKVIELSSFTTKYQVKGAEFSAAKTVKIPELVFDGGTTDYDRFKSEGRVELRCTSSLPAWGVRSKYFGARMVSVSRLPSTASPSSTSLSVEQGLARPVSPYAFRHELPLLEAAGLRSRAKVAERSSAVAWRKKAQFMGAKDRRGAALLQGRAFSVCCKQKRLFAVSSAKDSASDRLGFAPTFSRVHALSHRCQNGVGADYLSRPELADCSASSNPSRSCILARRFRQRFEQRAHLAAVAQGEARSRRPASHLHRPRVRRRGFEHVLVGAVVARRQQKPV